MLLTCAQCKTVFRIDNAALSPKGQQVRCSVCAHIWHVSAPALGFQPDRSDFNDILRKLRLPAAILLLVMFISGALFSFRGPLTAHFPSLISSFNGVGLAIEPDLDVLEIRNLQASYQGNLLRVRGQIYNADSFTAHAAPLQMQVIAADETLLASERLLPEHKFIPAGGITDFFVQKEIKMGTNAEVRVDLLPESLLLELF
ncbi:zinc-ribbon domain-containing protein [Alphaproteobacteria bacterium]|nr:zinc-ribbon domain-containing protein [Alphaproteobacteria bacterium]